MEIFIIATTLIVALFIIFFIVHYLAYSLFCYLSYKKRIRKRNRVRIQMGLPPLIVLILFASCNTNRIHKQVLSPSNKPETKYYKVLQVSKSKYGGYVILQGLKGVYSVNSDTIKVNDFLQIGFIKR